jgi:hypothetical protein
MSKGNSAKRMVRVLINRKNYLEGSKLRNTYISAEIDALNYAINTLCELLQYTRAELEKDKRSIAAHTKGNFSEG